MSARIDVACPKCGAEPYRPCRTVTTGRVTDTHSARWDAWAERNRARNEAAASGRT